jgi:phosphomannomutase
VSAISALAAVHQLLLPPSDETPYQLAAPITAAAAAPCRPNGSFVLLDGDKIAALAAMYLRQLLSHAPPGTADSISTGVVQTAYANGASTRFITEQLGLQVRCTKTGACLLMRRYTMSRPVIDEQCTHTCVAGKACASLQACNVYTTQPQYHVQTLDMATYALQCIRTAAAATAAAAAGVKYLHHEAKAFDVGIYFESNGHGTVLLKPSLLQRLQDMDENVSNHNLHCK